MPAERLVDHLRRHVFEAAMAANAIILGVFGVLGIGTTLLGLLVPRPLVVSLEGAYLIGGLWVLGGMTTGRPHLELGGLIMLGSAAVAWLIVSASTVGTAFLVGYFPAAMFHLLLAFACGGRAHALLGGEVVVVMRDD